MQRNAAIELYNSLFEGFFGFFALTFDLNVLLIFPPSFVSLFLF